jgi:hypothetical protein
MNANPVFRRTPEGQAALDCRDKRIPARMRALMLMAEGKPVDRFPEFAAGLGFGPESLDELIGLGFAVRWTGEVPGPSVPEVVAPGVGGQPAGPLVAATDGTTGAAGGVDPGTGDDVYAQFREASGLMRELAGDSMGMKAFFFILKIEKCSTLEDLGKLVPELAGAVTRQRGRTDAERLARRLYAIIG